MENQHRKITGYRELSQQEIDLMNKIKALGPVIEAVIKEVEAHLSEQYTATTIENETPEDPLRPMVRDLDLLQRIQDATPSRFQALAKTDFQTALMYLTRAVAQPTFF